MAAEVTRAAPLGTPGRALDPIERPAQAAERRLRIRRAILWSAKAMAGGLVAIAVFLILRKTGLIGERFARIILLVVMDHHAVHSRCHAENAF